MKDENEKKGGGFLGTVKGLFIETVSDEPKPDSEKPVDQPAPAPVVMPVAAGAVNQEIYNNLQASVQTQGPYYSKFLEMLATLQDVIPDEGMRYKAALKALEKGGSSFERISKSLADRSAILLQEQQSCDNDVVSRQQKIAELKEESGTIVDQIQILQQQITDLEKTKKAKDDDVTLAEQNLASFQSDFAAAMAAVQQSLANEADKLNRFLGGK